MPKDWSRRTRVKIAAVVAVLGFLVWADARWAGTDQCPPVASSAAPPTCPGR